jgi:hypothetical protein
MARMPFGKSLVFLLLLSFLPVVFPSPAAASVGYENRPYALADVPFEIFSWEKDGLLVAEISGQLDYPFSRIGSALARPQAWCQFLPLVFNIKSCTYEGEGESTFLNLYIGRKFYESPEEAIRLEYLFRVRERESDRLRVSLFAPEGPFGTRDYSIELEARPAADGRTIIRMHSSFRPSLASKLATQIYLATAGQAKVGFSVQDWTENGPVYVGGMKGIIERNAMRYYLALKAFLDTMQLPGENRFEATLQAWYGMTERYPRQLHEMGKEEYLEAKRRERQQQVKLQQELAGETAGSALGS